MARRKANGLENQMSLMDMMASESPEYVEEDPAELLDTGEDMGDSEGQTDKPFKRVANKTTKAKTQFQSHSERIIKNDGWGVSERLINYPAVSITSNKITSLTKDLSKRAIICRIGAKIDNERGAKNSKRVNESMSELTTAFYGEYVRRMLVCIDEMTTEMRENANGKEYFPDIFYASSSVIADIFRACKIDLPVYAHILSYDDYLGDKSIGRAAIEKIELAWQADPNKFRVDKKKNRLIYSYPQDGPWYELKYIADELPNSLEAEISGGNQLVMNYEQAQELFGIKFRRWLGIFNL